MSIGKTCWVIAEGYLPPLGPNPDDRTLRSHEAACILNPSDQPAKIAITLYFTDREPIGPYRLEVPARRTLHVRYDDLDDPQPLPREIDYSSVIESDVPVVVQHTRLDARDGIALMSTLAFGD
ncbi:sensory rhodopsin transducer [Pseudomonas sp.]|uniref:sensory rhodopsin transducer n=1 Tax=Pseudomonas sp. TaxID=306 RepID=UPI0028A5B7AF|nr:sensory rhodopsin transducer [Pseudomonas sp.]